MKKPAVIVGILVLLLLGVGAYERWHQPSPPSSAQEIGRKVPPSKADAAQFRAANQEAYQTMMRQRQAQVLARQTELDTRAQSAVASMKAQLHLPQKINDITNLDDIRAQRNQVVYDLSVNASGPDFGKLASQLHMSIRQSGCNRPDYKALFQQGLSVAINLRSVDKRHGTAILLTPQMCHIVPTPDKK